MINNVLSWGCSAEQSFFMHFTVSKMHLTSKALNHKAYCVILVIRKESDEK